MARIPRVGRWVTGLFFVFALLHLPSRASAQIPATSESPLVDSRKITTGATVSSIELEKIPTARDPWAVLQSVPGVIVDRVNVGGNESGQPSSFTGRGSATWSIDGVVITDPGAALGARPAGFDSYSVEFLRGGLEAEYGDALGGVLNVITKSGGNAFSGSFRVDFSAWDPAPDPFAGGGSPAVDFTIRDAPGGGICFEGFRFVDADGNPIPGLDAIPPDAGLGFAADPPIRLTIGGAWSSLDLDGDGVPDGRFGSVPSCGTGPALTLYDSFDLFGDPTHLYVGVDGVVPVDLSGILPDTKKTRVETTWGPNGPSEIYKLEDTDVFSSSFFLSGLLSYVGGGFRLEPEGGGRPIAPGDGFGMLGFGSEWGGVPATGSGFPLVDANGDGIGDTFFIQIPDLENPCPNLLGGFFTVDGIGSGGGRLTPDPAFGEIPCREYEGVILSDRYRVTDRWSFNLGYRYDDVGGAAPPARVDFRPAPSETAGDGFDSGGPIVRDKLWIWGAYGLTEPTHQVLSDWGATPVDADRTGLPEGRDPGTGSYFLSGNRAPVYDSGTGGFEWESITPRVGITYALGEERKTLLRASYSRFAEQLGTGFGVGDPSPFAYTYTDPGQTFGDGVLSRGGFLVGGFGDPTFGNPPPENGESRGGFVDLDGDGIAETLVLDFADFQPNACPGFDGPIGGFLPTDGGGLRPILPTPEDCGAFVPAYGGIRDAFDLGAGWYGLFAGRPDRDRDRDPLVAGGYTGTLTSSLFAELQYSEKSFTFGSVLDAPPANGIQDMGVEFLGSYEGRYAPGGAAPGDGPGPGRRPRSGDGADDPWPLLHFVARGGSTGEVMDVRIVHPPGAATPVEGFVAIEPVAATASDRERWESAMDRLEGEIENRTLPAYCLQFAAQAPPAGTVFRVAGRAKQEAFAPKARAMKAARRLHEASLLHPDTEPEGYFHSIRQWSLWTQERGLDADGFMEAFVDHTKKNVQAAGRAWSGEIEEVVRRSARGRWADVSRVLQEATP